MPIYQFRCYKCRHVFEKLSLGHKELVLCPDCGGTTQKIPSVPAFRRDHTLLEGEK